MKSSFVKTIQGHQLEFNKVSNTCCYKILPKNFEYKSALSLEKDEKGMWMVNDKDHLPAWFNEISSQVHFAIEENETKGGQTTGFLHFAYPF